MMNHRVINNKERPPRESPGFQTEIGHIEPVRSRQKAVGSYRRVGMIAPLFLLSAPSMSGCALNSQGDREVSTALAEYERRSKSAPAHYAGAGSSSPADASGSTTTRTQESSVDPESLAGLIATALERNPEIQSSIDNARSIASRIPQATSLMDPMLMTKTLPEPVRTAEGDNYFILGVQQQLPIPAKLDRRGRIALSETRMAIQELGQTRLRVIAEVKRAYFQVFAVDQELNITRENQTLLRDLIDVARGQLVAGKRQQEDVLRAQVERSNLESQLVVLAQRRHTTVALINSILDRPPGTPVASVQAYDIRRFSPRLKELLSMAMTRNPELEKIASQVERDEQSLELAKLAYWPDFTVGFEWMYMDPRSAFRPPVNPQTGMRPRVSQLSEEGTDNWAITVSLNLPVWFERIEAGIREARERLSSSRRKHHATKNKLTYQVEDALARINSQREVADLYATAIIPQAEQAFQVSREGYITGTSDFQFVIDNWQKWLFFRLQYFRTIAEMEQSVADLEQAVGVSMIEVESPVTSTQVGEGG